MLLNYKRVIWEDLQIIARNMQIRKFMGENLVIYIGTSEEKKGVSLLQSGSVICLQIALIRAI